MKGLVSTIYNRLQRYDFTRKGIRYTEVWFKTKKEATKADAKQREELEHPAMIVQEPTVTGFLELVNLRLDHVKAYNSSLHYSGLLLHGKEVCRELWVKRWGKLSCSEITQHELEKYILIRSKVSACTANKDMRYLRATFNYGKKKKLLKENPLDSISFLPEEKRVKYVPSPADIDKVIAEADQDTQDYLWTIRESLGRMNEINRLTWDDVDFKNSLVILYTRKKKGGHLTPRRVPMTSKLEKILTRRYGNRDTEKPWVFWHKYWSSKESEMVSGPFQDRKKIMKILCEKAGVKYFRYHALRHAGASMMDVNNVAIGVIQRILGHENRTTTEIYLHSMGDSERLGMAVYEGARQKSHTDSHTDKNRLQP